MRQAIELQNLKANYSAVYGDIAVGTDTPLLSCNYFPVNCTTSPEYQRLSAEENVTVTVAPPINITDFDNDTFMDFGNFTTDLEVSTLLDTLYNVTGWGELNESDVLGANGSLSDFTTPGVVLNASTTVGPYLEDSRNVCYERKCESAVSEDKPRGVRREMTGSMFDMETRKKLRRLCWETMFGQELVKLTVMDLVSHLCLCTTRRLIS